MITQTILRQTLVGLRHLYWFLNDHYWYKSQMVVKQAYNHCLNKIKQKAKKKMNEKPPVKLIGTDGNVFAIIGKVSAGLKRAGMREKAAEFTQRALSSKSYDEVLCLCGEYVEIR